MCGICGYFNGNNEAALDAMLHAMVHRGPDEEGRFVESGIALGIRRLSVIDPEGGHQPVCNEARSVRVVQNGEIYNFRELRRELEQKGHVFSTRSDTEVIAHLYEEEGVAMVKRLRGMFSIALFDVSKRTMYLFRDRLGIKPLYYTVRGSSLFFASELSALKRAVAGFSVNSRAVAQYMTLLYIPCPDTIYENVYQLPPGHLLKINESGVEVKPYFSLSDINRAHQMTPSESCEQFRAVLKDSVRAHLVSDVPLGLFLSGGLDSGAILAMTRSLTDGPIKTFSIGYKDKADKDFNETGAARMMAKRFNAEHVEELLSPDVAGLLDSVVGAMDEPFADASAIPTYLVSKLAREHVVVALSGAGGDELFGGYPRYAGMRASGAFSRLPLFLRKFLAGSIAPAIPERGGHRDNLARLKRFLKTGSMPLDKQYATWTSFIDVEWAADAFMGSAAGSAVVEEVLRAPRALFNDDSFHDPADKAMAVDIRTYLPDDLLRMGDRMSMAHSLEARVPFCDVKLLEFAFTVPPTTRFCRGQLKGFMREALKDVLPPEIIKAPKRGFMTPLARWLRDDLKDMAGDILSEDAVRRRGYINPAYVKWLMEEHQSGRRNFSDQIYSLLVLELWLRQN